MLNVFVCDLYVLLLLLLFIENADATPPHLNVLVRLCGSLGVHGSLQFFALGLLSLFSCFERCGCAPGRF